MHMFKKLIIIIFTILLFTSIIHAHVLDANGNVGAVMHIDSDDDPIAGQPAIFYFEFKDKTNKLDFSKCSCKLAISNTDNEVLYRDNLPLNSNNANLSTPSFEFVFPKRDVYNLTITGDPINNALFTHFQLSYDIRVSRENFNNAAPIVKNNNIIILYILPVIVILSFGLFVFISIRKTRNK